MAIWAIADLHLSFGVPEKTMEVFGPEWKSYGEKLQSNWIEVVQSDDLVLIAGDISWAMRPEEAQKDLDWIEALPGTKVMIKGNHDYWWSSLSKTKKILPPSIHIIQNDAFHWKEYTIGGARLWDTHEYTFDAYIDFQEAPVSPSQQEKIFSRELDRLELSLKKLDPNATTHIPHPLKI